MERELQIELNRRDRQRYLEELSELESSLASAQKGIFWATLNLLIVNPLFTTAAVYYFWDQFQTAYVKNLLIANFWQNVKYVAIGLAITFTITSLTLLYYLWRVASLQSQIAKIRAKINRLER